MKLTITFDIYADDEDESFKSMSDYAVAVLNSGAESCSADVKIISIEELKETK